MSAALSTLIKIIQLTTIVKQILKEVKTVKLLHIAKILFLIALLIPIGLVGCGDEYDEDYDDDYDDDDDHDDDDDDDDRKAANYLGVIFDNPADAGRPSPSFNADILPILTNRCAFAGCHVAGGPGGIDLRTYNTLIAGGEDEDIIIAGDARDSELVEQIVEGEMPPNGPPLPAAQIQLIIDWINEGAKNN